MCRSACQASLNLYSAEKFHSMTAKKKAPSTKSAKAATPKSKVAKPAAKKTATKPAVKKATATKTAAKKKVASPKVAKPAAKKVSTKASSQTKSSGTKKAPAKKAPIKKTAAKKAPSQQVAKKGAPKKTVKIKAKKGVKSNESESVTKKVASAILSKSNEASNERASDGLGFSIDDVRNILQNRKKSTKKPKPIAEDKVESKKSVKNTAEKKVSKVKKIQTASIDDILGFGTVSVAKKPIRDEKKVPKEWESYYKTLKAMRDSLKGSLGARSSETIGASARESGELSLNSSDAGTETFDRDLALSMVANDQEALEEIEDAIDRIFDGSYGICQETNKPIKKNRLQAVPFTRFSLEGQMQYEKSSRRERDSGAGAFATISDSTMGQDD